ncbi:hypothetical protein FRB94_005966 [Tulasnella sp. JGI-2019a]|nr:hypothetical protein FRB93_013484 [Tulasnella sp. JGI-2019a]KAG8999713.1 hypothetical protein FRB94_005966 [Tulasnella sp. JGI-2019a]
MSATLDSLVPTLDGLLASIKSNTLADDTWHSVETCAKQIADGLRTRNGPVDNHSQLGKSSLPGTLSGLLKEATRNGNGDTKYSKPTSPASAVASYELLRVGANLCMDHDDNRQRLLDAGYTDSVLSLLKAYSMDVSKVSETGTAAANATLNDLKLVKTAVGALLNASMGYEPVRGSLVSAGAPSTIVTLSSRLYSPGSWASATSDDAVEQWTWRSGLSAWSWRALETLKGSNDDDDDNHEEAERPSKQHLTLDSGAVSSLIHSLRGFIPPYPTSITNAITSKTDRQAFAVADIEFLEETSMLLESLTLDSVDVRRAIAAGSISSPTPTAQNPFPPPLLLTTLLNFVETGAPPEYWSACTDSPTEKKRWLKSFGICKAAVIKAIVAIPGEDKNLDVLWDAQVGSYPGGPFVERMVGWIKNTKVEESGEADEGRDDLIICATLSLGNLARRPSHCIALLAAPVSLTPHFLPLLNPKTNIKLKHGCIGLLKHLAQPPPNKAILGDAGVVEALLDSRIWAREGDIGEPVQFGAVGVVKHLSYEYLPNALRLVRPNPSLEGDSALDLILDLVRRSDSIGLQSEGTRVLVNVVKCLFSSTSASGKPNGIVAPLASDSAPDLKIRTTGLVNDDKQERQQAIDRLATADSVEPLTDMIGRSGRYPILLNESVVALTLLSSVTAGRTCVLQALLAPLPYGLSESGAILASSAPSEGQAQITSAETSEDKTTMASPQSTPQTSSPMDMLVVILRNINGAFPPELGVNVCTLLASLTPPTKEATTQDKEFAKVKITSKGALESVAAGLSGRSFANGPPKVMQAVAKRTLEVWSTSEGK